MTAARTLWIPGRPISFARPSQVQVGNRGRRIGVTPERYREWRRTAERYVALQTRAPITEPTTITVSIHANGALVTLAGEAHAPDRPAGKDPRTGHRFTLTGDLDNYTKAVLDALEHGGALANDKLVHALASAFDPAPHPEPERLTR